MSKYTFGRPPIYDNPEDMQAKISEYFEQGVTQRQVTVGPPNNRQVVLMPVPTITGLVLYLGFADRSSFYDYEAKPDFFYTIKKARTFIEKEYEEILQTTGNSGAIFALKNFGWHDKREVEIDDKRETEEKMKDFLDASDTGDDLQHDSQAADPDDTEEA